MTDKLLDEIKGSITAMQTQMQSTYQNLSTIQVSGESHDKTVKIILTGTYGFSDIEFNEKALQGGVKEFKQRIKEAWTTAIEQVQQATQNKTIELLQQMQIPEEIKNLSLEEKKQDEDSEGGDK